MRLEKEQFLAFVYPSMCVILVISILYYCMYYGMLFILLK